MSADIDMQEILELLEGGASQSEIAATTGFSVATIQRKVAALVQNQPIYEQYRNVQHLQLTDLQARILDAVTEEKIATASLKELMSAFKVLKEKEQVDLGKPTEIKGLVAYLIHLEQEDIANKSPTPSTVVETTAKEVTPESRTDKRESFVVGVPQF